MSAQPYQNEGLIPIGKGLYLRKPIEIPPSNASSSSASTPTHVHQYLSGPIILIYFFRIILIFAWMGARLPHVRKYADSYDEIYPKATKIIVQSEPSFFWSTERRKKAYLTPVVEVLELLGCLPPATTPSKLVKYADIKPIIPYPTPRVLVHAFSNGGSWQLSTLSEMLATRTTTSSYSNIKLSPTAVILDSCPGNGGVERTIKAFTGVMRSPLLRALVTLFIRVMYIYAAFKSRISRKQNTIMDTMKATLNTPKLLPWMSKDTPRLYLYSKTDEIIPYQEVEAHAAQAKASGLLVRTEVFDDSPHVAHARMHTQRYWDAVRKLWDDASTDKL